MNEGHISYVFMIMSDIIYNYSYHCYTDFINEFKVTLFFIFRNYFFIGKYIHINIVRL